MKTIVFSKDKELIEFINSNFGNNETIIYQSNDNLIEAFAFTLLEKPSLLIIDDDLTKPNTIVFIKNIKNVGKKNFIILITSNESLDFGREVSNLEILHYSIKPCNYVILSEFINSITNYTTNAK
jgi:two-component SAPR family response regulator